MVDSHGTWMHSLKSDVERLGVDVMRMPVNIHPSPKPLALKYYAEKHKRHEVGLVLIRWGGYTWWIYSVAACWVCRNLKKCQGVHHCRHPAFFWTFVLH